MPRTTFVGFCASIICIGLLAVPAARPQQREAPAPADPVQQRLRNLEEAHQFARESLTRNVDEQMLFHRLEDLAEVDKVRFTGPPPRVVKNPTAQGAGNPVILSAYTFLPRKHLSGSKFPLVILVHGGVHGSFDTGYVAILRELLLQGYAVLKG